MSAMLALTTSPASAHTNAVASFYGVGDGFHGQLTCSGEVFDAYDYTAASLTYPLGTTLAVTYPPTGRTVYVRVSDCGPYIEGRSLDLSYAAARDIGLVEAGIGAVEVVPIAYN